MYGFVPFHSWYSTRPKIWKKELSISSKYQKNIFDKRKSTQSNSDAYDRLPL